MDPKEQEEISSAKLMGRIRKSWAPLTAVAAAFTAFVAAAFRTRPEPAHTAKSTGSRNASGILPVITPPAEPAEGLKRAYTLKAVLCGKGSDHRFRHSLLDLAVDAGDVIFSLGDGEVRIFAPDGTFARSWGVGPEAACLEPGPGGCVYVGAPGRVEIYTSGGKHTGGMAVGEPDAPAAVTAIKRLDNAILVADAKTRLIYRYELDGSRVGIIGDRNKTGSFMLPNGWLDFDVDSTGRLYATDTGRHRVTEWLSDGTPDGAFGKFGMQDPANFVGCCNPVNVAVTPAGNVVTAEKMIARVKVFSPEGELLAYIGPENFHQKCRNVHLAVDSRGRILTADPLHREIKIFAPAAAI
jgi:sugar lactone lactonase YvrE